MLWIAVMVCAIKDVLVPDANWTKEVLVLDVNRKSHSFESNIFLFNWWWWWSLINQMSLKLMCLRDRFILSMMLSSSNCRGVNVQWNLGVSIIAVSLGKRKTFCTKKMLACWSITFLNNKSKPESFSWFWHRMTLAKAFRYHI